mmetsp:Transcript_101584/g.296123  ORF Transcript_101584/g.296123 Transcript_101584/m.296123 type:complete len:223 (+) Transcript_101584:1072-1740(+)
MSSMPPARRSIACWRAFRIAAPAFLVSALRPSSVEAASMTRFLWSNAPAKSPLKSSFMPGNSEAPEEMPAPRAPKRSPERVSIADDAAPRAPCNCSLPELPMKVSNVLHMAPESLSDFSAASDKSSRSRRPSEPTSSHGRPRLRKAFVISESLILSVEGFKTSDGTQLPKRLRLERAPGVTSSMSSSHPCCGSCEGSWKRSYCSWMSILGTGLSVAPCGSLS